MIQRTTEREPAEGSGDQEQGEPHLDARGGVSEEKRLTGARGDRPRGRPWSTLPTLFSERTRCGRSARIATTAAMPSDARSAGTCRDCGIHRDAIIAAANRAAAMNAPGCRAYGTPRGAGGRAWAGGPGHGAPGGTRAERPGAPGSGRRRSRRGAAARARACRRRTRRPPRRAPTTLPAPRGTRGRGRAPRGPGRGIPGDQEGVRVEDRRDVTADQVLDRGADQVVGVRVVLRRSAPVPVDEAHARQPAVAGPGDPRDAVGVERGVPVLRDGRQPPDATQYRERADDSGQGHDRGDAHVGATEPVGGARCARLVPPAWRSGRRRRQRDECGGDEAERAPGDAEPGGGRARDPGDAVGRQGSDRGGRPPATARGEQCRRAGEPPGRRWWRTGPTSGPRQAKVVGRLPGPNSEPATPCRGRPVRGPYGCSRRTASSSPLTDGSSCSDAVHFPQGRRAPPGRSYPHRHRAFSAPSPGQEASRLGAEERRHRSGVAGRGEVVVVEVDEDAADEDRRAFDDAVQQRLLRSRNATFGRDIGQALVGRDVPRRAPLHE